MATVAWQWVNNGVLAEVQLTIGEVSPRSYPVSEYVIGLHITNSCQNPHNGSQTCGVRTAVVGKPNASR